MTSSATCPHIPYPAPRDNPLDPPGALSGLSGELAKAVLWDGSEAWIVTSHALTRTLLKDRRLSSNPASPGFPMMTAASKVLRNEPRSASFIRMDQPEHAHLRTMLSNRFRPVDAEALRGVVGDLVDQRLDALDGATEADLVPAVASPLPASVIAKVLGIAEEDQEFFEDRSARLIDRNRTMDEVRAAREELDAFLDGEVEKRITEPREDLISAIVHEQMLPGHIERQDVVPMCRLVLVAGHGTTASQLALSLMSVLDDAPTRAAVRAGGSGLVAVVDELLRFHTIVQFGLTRAALEDIDVDGTTIKAGEGVVFAIGAGNRDEDVFAGPDALDPDRDARRHLAFGHGAHQCLGQWLAKVEVEECLHRFVSRFPEATLATPASELSFRHTASSYGLDALPVRLQPS
ncbi:MULTISPECIES: cytochrome P450 [unclassified Knoellia]|uniref:cytochrome P450 n=1 Tax=Knoellia altitudinis TaxID=3404795 RepID=UPI003615F42B